MDGAQVGVFEETDEVGLAGFLQGHDGGALETQVSLEVLCDFTNQALEGQLADQQLSALLVATDLTKGHCAGPVAMGLLHAAGGGCALASGLGGELLAGSLASGGFAGGLLRTCHFGASKESRRRDLTQSPESALVLSMKLRPSATLERVLSFDSCIQSKLGTVSKNLLEYRLIDADTGWLVVENAESEDIPNHRRSCRGGAEHRHIRSRGIFWWILVWLRGCSPDQACPLVGQGLPCVSRAP